MEIDWKELLDGGNFVKLETAKPKTLVLSEWKPQDKFKDDKTGELRKGLTFKVTMEDTETVEKEYTVTAMKAVAQFRPIIEKAIAEGKTSITVTIVKVGENKSTQYSITDNSAPTA